MNNCLCCTKHVPAPMETAALDTPTRGVVYLCATASANLEHLLREYARIGGTPTGAVTKHYGRLIRLLAKDIYFATEGLDRQ